MKNIESRMHIHIYDFTYTLYNTYQESIKRHIDFMLQFRNCRRSRVVSIRNIWTALKKNHFTFISEMSKTKTRHWIPEKIERKIYFFVYFKERQEKIGAMNGANVKVHFKSQTNFSWLLAMCCVVGEVLFEINQIFISLFALFFLSFVSRKKMLIVYPVRVS